MRARIYIIGIAALLVALLLPACSITYSFNGASIDYNKTKTIQINDFPIRSNYVWGPMASIFNNQLKDQYANHTKLQQVKRNGDLKLEGEITRYEQRNKSVSAEGSSAQVELSITVNVRFTNNTKHEEDFERTFTASQSYDSNSASAPCRKNWSPRWSPTSATRYSMPPSPTGRNPISPISPINPIKRKWK